MYTRTNTGDCMGNETCRIWRSWDETEKILSSKIIKRLGRFSVFVSYFVSQCVRRMREWDENFSNTKKSVVKEQFSTRPITLERNSICAQSQATRKTKESARRGKPLTSEKVKIYINRKQKKLEPEGNFGLNFQPSGNSSTIARKNAKSRTQYT